jgi:hypothetical protein
MPIPPFFIYIKNNTSNNFSFIKLNEKTLIIDNKQTLNYTGSTCSDTICVELLTNNAHTPIKIKITYYNTTDNLSISDDSDNYFFTIELNTTHSKNSNTDSCLSFLFGKNVNEGEKHLNLVIKDI